MSISWISDQKVGFFWVFLGDLKVVDVGLKVFSTSVAGGKDFPNYFSQD